MPTGTGSGVPVSPPMVHSSQDKPRSSPTESRTGPVLFHRHLSDRMGSQLERLPHLGILDYRAPGVPHKLVRDESSQTGGSPLWFPVARSDAPPVLRQQHDSCLHSETGGHQILDSVYQNSGTVKPIGSPSHSSNSNSSTGISQHDSRCVVQNEQSQSYRMATTTGDLEQYILCLGKPSGRHVCHSSQQSGSHLCVSLPGRDSMGGRRPINLLGQFRFGVHVSTSCDSSQDPGQDSKVLRHAGHSDSVPESIQALASHSPKTEPTSSDTFTGRPTLPVPSSPSLSSVLPGHETVRLSRLDVTLQALRNHTFTEPVVEMASASIRDSSSHLYITHWKLFTDWLAPKTFQHSLLLIITYRTV